MRRLRLAPAALLVALLIVPASASAADGPFLYAVEPAGDVDGDGHGDLLALWVIQDRSFTRYTPLDESRAIVETLSGADGSVLASHSEPGELWWYVFGPVGTSEAGVVLHVERDHGAGYAATSDYRLVAVTAGGDVAWRHEISGVEHLVSGDTISLWEGADIVAGPALDVITFRHQEGLPHSGIGSRGTGFDVLDGSTGAIAASFEGTQATLFPGPDVTGDGTGELYRVTEDEQARPTMTALRLPEAETVWSVQGGPFDRYSWPKGVGDLDGDGITELSVSVSAGETLIVDGGSGAKLALVPYREVEPAGDIDGDGAPDLLATAEVGQGSESYFVEYRGLTATGATIYTRTHGLHRDGGSWVGLDRRSMGDADGDGVIDRWQATTLQLPGEVRNATGVVSGRTGEFLWSPEGRRAAHARPAASFDGHGSDLLELRCDAGSLVVEAFAGDDGATLWATEPGLPCGAQREQVTDLDDDGIVDVVVSWWSGSQVSVSALSGADGSQLWSV